MDGVRPLVVVEADPSDDAVLDLRTDFPCAKVDAILLQGPRKLFDEDVVEVTPLTAR